jgi:hypothetical protein
LTNFVQEHIQEKGRSHDREICHNSSPCDEVLVEIPGTKVGSNISTGSVQYEES